MRTYLNELSWEGKLGTAANVTAIGVTASAFAMSRVNSIMTSISGEQAYILSDAVCDDVMRHGGLAFAIGSALAANSILRSKPSE